MFASQRESNHIHQKEIESKETMNHTTVHKTKNSENESNDELIPKSIAQLHPNLRTSGEGYQALSTKNGQH